MRNGQKRDFARAMRREAMAVEWIIWRMLRDRRFGGVKFRRQAPIGPYIADFACPSHRLVVELDGGQHAEEGSDRQRWLESEGYRVLRFWNNEVFENRTGVLHAIANVLGPWPSVYPHPGPPPQAGEGDPDTISRPKSPPPLAGEG